MSGLVSRIPLHDNHLSLYPLLPLLLSHRTRSEAKRTEATLKGELNLIEKVGVVVLNPNI